MRLGMCPESIGASKMARDWEADFRRWSKPSSDDEAEKCDRVERMIHEAIDASDWLKGKVSRVFAKGSYKNNTNVRLESDVDICVQGNCRYWNASAVPGYKPSTCSYTFVEFKNEVERALVAKFGRGGVSRGDKAFDVHQTTTRVDADVVACFGYRHYWDGTMTRYVDGTRFKSDSGTEITNWPDQQLANGNAKNVETALRYKYITRAVKRLRNEMADSGIAEAEPIPSYLIECLVWNVPNDWLGHADYYDDVRWVLVNTIPDTASDEKCKDWLEVNRRKYLFRTSQPWTREQVYAFCGAAWEYVGFSA
jgi:hypothetical protein